MYIDHPENQLMTMMVLLKNSSNSSEHSDCNILVAGDLIYI